MRLDQCCQHRCYLATITYNHYVLHVTLSILIYFSDKHILELMNNDTKRNV